eukprot:TRINITY_DN11682_c0_g1_i1.p2 TRINITY_DN11682_c0_g1~~TRINITY_DN11682_c0_g1_i1.p2  ORF type:complete len:255 (+),score=89.29 TRINITY_DN11682_c0_g1_i1:98-766(+)
MHVASGNYGTVDTEEGKEQAVNVADRPGRGGPTGFDRYFSLCHMVPFVVIVLGILTCFWIHLDQTVSAMADKQGQLEQALNQLNSKLDRHELEKQFKHRGDSPSAQGGASRGKLPDRVRVVSPDRPDVAGEYALLPPQADGSSVWGGGPTGQKPGWIYKQSSSGCWVVTTGNNALALGSWWDGSHKCDATSLSPDTETRWQFNDEQSSDWLFSSGTSVKAEG